MRRNGGFTLLEALVALAVTATALVVLQRATADALRARSLVAADVERRGGLTATLVHLTTELGVAVPGTLHIEPATASAPAVLEFALDEPAPVVVRYRVVGRRLERTAAPRFALDGADGETAVLLPDVAALEVRGRGADGWHDRWDEARAPALVAVNLRLGSGERLATVVPLLAGGQP